MRYAGRRSSAHRHRSYASRRMIARRAFGIHRPMLLIWISTFPTGGKRAAARSANPSPLQARFVRHPHVWRRPTERRRIIGRDAVRIAEGSPRDHGPHRYRGDTRQEGAFAMHRSSPPGMSCDRDGAPRGSRDRPGRIHLRDPRCALPGDDHDHGAWGQPHCSSHFFPLSELTHLV
jgi:hypothetical protein